MILRNQRFLTVSVIVAAVLLGAVLVQSAPTSGLTVHDKAYYAAAANFIRPGLILKVDRAEIATDGTIRAWVRITDPKSQPLDRLGVTTPGTISASMVAAYIPKDATQYVSYTTRTQTSSLTGKSAVQAGADSGGTWTLVSDGYYQYTFATKVPASANRGVTHTIAIYGSRNLSEFDMGTQYSDGVFHFVPDGTAKPAVRDVVTTTACNACHDQMAFHGGSRRTVPVCIVCHTPQTTDPDTGNTVDMPVMVHKIHMGSSLPSVKAGKKYQIIGNAGSVHDYSAIAFPPDARTCKACHDGTAAQADNVYKANMAACGACHDDVNFASGANHVNLPVTSDAQCSGCHVKEGEILFDGSIIGSHTLPLRAKTMPGIVAEILEVKDGVPGKSPTVGFSLKDKAGNAIKASELTRLSLILSGPNSDYKTYVSESALAAGGSGGVYFWTFAAKIPADAKGSYTVSLEARKDVILLPGTTKQVTTRDVAANKQFYFSVDGTQVEARRKVVSTAKCNACHYDLNFHGNVRNDVQECVICHNPTLTSRNGDSFEFKTMIHRLHTGAELQITYLTFNEVGYPGDRRNCNACHIDNSQQLPLDSRLSPVTDPKGYLNPVSPASAACLGCHTSLDAASHALANTSKLGESCAACHGPSGDFSVDKVHAR